MDKRWLIAWCVGGWVLFEVGSLLLASGMLIRETKWRVISLVTWAVLFEVVAIATWYRVSYRQHVQDREPGSVIGLVILAIVAVAMPILSLLMLWRYGVL